VFNDHNVSRPPLFADARKPGWQARDAPSEFVSNLAKELLSLFHVRLAFNPPGRQTIHDAHDGVPLIGFGHQHLSWIGRGAENPADLGHDFDGIEHIDGIKTLREEEDKAVPGADGQGVLLGQFNHIRIGASPAHQAFAG